MSPRALDHDAVLRRLQELDRLLRWLDELGTPTGEELREDWRTRLLVERLLEQLVEIAVSTNLHLAGSAGVSRGGTYRDSFEAAASVGAIKTSLARELAPSAGLRIVLVHDYLDVDHDVVAAAIPMALDLFGVYRRQVGRWLAAQER